MCSVPFSTCHTNAFRRCRLFYHLGSHRLLKCAACVFRLHFLYQGHLFSSPQRWEDEAEKARLYPAIKVRLWLIAAGGVDPCRRDFRSPYRHLTCNLIGRYPPVLPCNPSHRRATKKPCLAQMGTFRRSSCERVVFVLPAMP